MKIHNITNYYNTPFKAAESNPKEKKKLSHTEKAAYGIAGVALISLGTYFVLRNRGNSVVKQVIEKTGQTVNKSPSNTAKPIPIPQKPAEKPKELTIENFTPYFDLKPEVTKKNLKNGTTITYEAIEGDKTYRDILVINKNNELTRRITYFRSKIGQMWSRVYKGDKNFILKHPDKLPKSKYDSTYLVKEFSGDARKPFGINGEGTERLTRVAYPDGHSKTYQGFFNKNKKLHEYTVYYDKFDNTSGCFDQLHLAKSEYIINYNYAYKDGKLAGIAKQERLKDNYWLGIQQADGFDAFPQYINLKDGKGFNEFKGDLYIKHPEFDPEQI